jgi:hypothetical protein
LQIVFVTHAKERVCHRSCLKKKIIVQKFNKTILFKGGCINSAAIVIVIHEHKNITSEQNPIN